MENSKKYTFLECMSRISEPRKPYHQMHDFFTIVAMGTQKKIAEYFEKEVFTKTKQVLESKGMYL